MHLRCCLLALLIIPGSVFSQTSVTEAGSKANIRHSVNYYLKNTNLPRSFVTAYVKLVSGISGYSKKDTLDADKLIKRLYQFNDIVLYRLMRIRLVWEFRQHLQRSPLDSVVLLLKNKNDSANYYYTQGIYFTDSLNEKTAYKFGYVKTGNDGNEYVDWAKMKKLRWGNPKWLENIDGDAGAFQARPMKDTLLSYFKKAIELDPTEFYYLKEALFVLYRIGEDVATQELIIQQQSNYTIKEKTWLNEFLTASYNRSRLL